MAQTAAHLVDHVFPHVRVRQWVLSPYQVVQGAPYGRCDLLKQAP